MARSNKPSSSRRTPTQRKALTKLSKLMRGIDLCMMTTVGDRGAFHTRPMSNNGEVEFDGDAWFFSHRDSVKIKELKRDPSVSLSYVGGTKTKPVWIALTGRGEVIRDEETKRELWVDELERWFDGGPEDPEVVVIKVSAKRIQWWQYDEGGEISI
ncbi:MAG: pyridoxamine 5'-phosphate oxidase family protein [Kofleriaceae bacterium]